MVIIEGIDKIKSKMLSQAKEQADKILSEAQVKVEEIKSLNKKRIDQFIKSEKEKIAAESALLANRELAFAQMQSKKFFMESREEIINKLIEESIASLNKDKGYEKFMENILKEYASLLGNKITLECNNKDVSLVEKLIKKLKITAKVEKGDLKAGLIFKGAGSRINMSIGSVLEEKIRIIRKEIVTIIGA